LIVQKIRLFQRAAQHALHLTRAFGAPLYRGLLALFEVIA
jgi:hypothetical protein